MGVKDFQKHKNIDKTLVVQNCMALIELNECESNEWELNECELTECEWTECELIEWELIECELIECECESQWIEWLWN